MAMTACLLGEMVGVVALAFDRLDVIVLISLMIDICNCLDFFDNGDSGGEIYLMMEIVKGIFELFEQ